MTYGKNVLIEWKLNLRGLKRIFYQSRTIGKIGSFTISILTEINKQPYFSDKKTEQPIWFTKSAERLHHQALVFLTMQENHLG